MALSDKTKEVFIIFMDKRFADPAYEMEFRGNLINKGLPAIDCANYAFAFHDLDIHTDTKVDGLGNVIWNKGDSKTPHFHVWASCRTTRRLSTYLSKLSQSLDFPVLGISIEKSVSMAGCIQYLIHKNDSDKHQYHRSAIFSNLEPSEIDVILEEDSSPFSVDMIVNAWNSSSTMPEFVKKIGLNRFNTYFKTIKALTNDFRHNY